MSEELQDDFSLKATVYDKVKNGPSAKSVWFLSLRFWGVLSLV